MGGHRLFAWISHHHPAAHREMCYSGFESTPVLTDESVFSWLDACSQMYFVESGALRYLPCNLSRERRLSNRVIRHMRLQRCGIEMEKRSWLCEPAVWLQ